NINTLERIGRRANKIAHIKSLCDIAIAENCLAAIGDNIGGNFFALLFVNIRKNDFRTRLRKAPRDDAPYAIRSTCDNRNLAAQLTAECHVTFLQNSAYPPGAFGRETQDVISSPARFPKGAP